MTDEDVRHAFDSNHEYKTSTVAQPILIHLKPVIPDMRIAGPEDLMWADKINAFTLEYVTGVAA